MKLLALKGVGPKLVEKLANLGILSTSDLLFHLPYKYQDRTSITPLNQLAQNMAVVVEGQVSSAQILFGRKRSLLVRLTDGSGVIGLRFYYFNKTQQNQLSQGALVRCFGEIRRGQTGYEMYHPEYQILKSYDEPMEGSLTPIYPSTEGINQNKWQQMIDQIFEKISQVGMNDYLPKDITERLNFPTLVEALTTLHHPSSEEESRQLLEGVHIAQKRLAIEELCAHQLSLLKKRQIWQQQTALNCGPSDELLTPFLASLPFTPTNAQKRVYQQIRNDLSGNIPMLRLVQGDVGSGKTLVAVMAALQVVENNGQVALMAPTEILAQQHFNNLSNWLEPLGVKVVLLLGKQSKKQRQTVLEQLMDGTAQVSVGTHALFQDEVEFKGLALAIIDEQHRFGVHQRLALRQKGLKSGFITHQLVMTATPIPRTLAMSAYADLDYSVIDELPPGRTAITTNAVSHQRKPQVVERVKSACVEGRQVYWVCTLIDESEELQLQAAQVAAQELEVQLPDQTVGLIHGRLKAAEKIEIMERFKQKEIDILVATTVIEVGVDVPNASVMIIENPERLGLAQLHQLRGRVGRGSIDSHCLLLYGDKLSESGKTRINAMRETTDGFKIAEIDLKLRGPGELLGTKQTGAVQFKVADLERDAPLMDDVASISKELLEKYPHVVEPLVKRWVYLADQFTQV